MIERRLTHFTAAIVFSAASLLAIYALQSTPRILAEPQALAALIVVPALEKKQPLLEVHIANNGHVHIRGARITRMHRGVVDAITKWGFVDLVWTIDTSGSTRYVGKNGESIPREELAVGDFVSITGSLRGGGRSPQVGATYIRISR